MKFSGSVTINKSRELVTKLFIDPTYLDHYQEGFIRKNLVSGEPSTNGCISLMYYKHGKNEMELKETISNNNLPETFEAFYEHIHMDNTMKCVFTELDSNTTKYDFEFEYVRVSKGMPKLMMRFFPGMFKKPANRWMNNFKKFVEEFEG